MPDNQELQQQVEDRAKSLMPPEPKIDLEPQFIKGCLDTNERGDGVLFATMFSDSFLQNVTPKDDEWFTWKGNVWEPDDKKCSIDAVEECALEYQRMADDLQRQVDEEEIDKKHPDAWKLELLKKYKSRVTRLRGKAGAKNALFWAPIVHKDMACKEEDFNQRHWMLPVANGTVDLETGGLISSQPKDLMTKALNVEYDPHADYSLWVKVLQEITNSEEEIPNFLKRSFGYAATGFSFEQYIWLFLGPGRNGKGIIFNMISEVLGPFFHTINPSMLLEQRNPPSPAAASEHLYSLLGKRLIVGSETNKNKKIDAAAVKELTGEDEINCRPNFKSEIIFYPTHTLMLRTNNVPIGMTQDFAMKERLFLLNFPFRYVDDVEAHKLKEPMFADQFRPKDKFLKDKLREIKPGILRWIVEGCREWQETGLNPPQSVIDAVDKLGMEEDYIGRFVAACLVAVPDDPDKRLKCTAMYDAFQWWWSENEGVHEQRRPAMKTVNKGLRERGFVVDQKGGVTWVFGCQISLDVALDVNEYVQTKGK